MSGVTEERRGWRHHDVVPRRRTERGPVRLSRWTGARDLVRQVVRQWSPDPTRARSEARKRRTRRSHEGPGGARASSADGDRSSRCSRATGNRQGRASCYLEHLEHVLERKPTTVSDYRSMLTRHLEPFFGVTALERITAEDVAAYMAAKSARACGRRRSATTSNFLHGLFCVRASSAAGSPANPVAAVDRPRAAGADPDIRYLDLDEVEALLRAVPDDDSARPSEPLYLTAAMTGLRQGELVALRWQDVDWQAARMRVRRNYTRGRFGTPKTRRSSRAVPMADRVAGELERHFQRSALPGRRGPRLLPSPHRPSARRLEAAQAVQGGARSRRRAARPLPRPAPHLRHRDWRPRACRCGRCRSGWATATSRRRRSTPTTPRALTRANWSSRHSVVPFVVPI